MKRSNGTGGHGCLCEGVSIVGSEIIVAGLSMLGTLIGSFGGSRLTAYRIEQLEKRVDKHNTLIERTYILEEQMKVANHRIEDLEELERSRGA